jgi:hypothetical protein
MMRSSTEESLLFKAGKGVALRRPPFRLIDSPTQNNPSLWKSTPPPPPRGCLYRSSLLSVSFLYIIIINTTAGVSLAVFPQKKITTGEAQSSQNFTTEHIYC